MVTSLEIDLINMAVKSALIIGIFVGVYAVTLCGIIVEIHQKKRLLKLLKSKDDKKILSMFWGIKEEGKK